MPEWDIYREIRKLLDSGEASSALAAIAEQRGQMPGIPEHVAVLEAQALAMLGRSDDAINALQVAIDLGVGNFWIYFNLAHMLRQAGRPDEGIIASQQAHASLGWPESARNGYRFTHDYFASNIPNWQNWFANHINAAPINCLEIGAWQGGSTCWLLDKVVAPRGGTLISIDTFEGSSEHASFLNRLGADLELIFDDNVRRTGHGRMHRKIVGRSQDVMRWLPDDRFDFIYIDGAHEAKYVIQDAALAWPLLRAGGYMLFDDVGFTFPEAPEQNTANAVDVFCRFFGNEIKVITREWQLLLQRVSPGSRRSGSEPPIAEEIAKPG